VPIGLPDDVIARIPPLSLAIDIGANVGAVTGQLAGRVTTAGRVWAIEPVPRNVARLTALAGQNHLPIDVLSVAAGTADGSVELRLADQSGWASVTTSWIDAGRLTVPVRSLDSLIAERQPRWPLSFIKIDVQAYEPEVLAGARETLAYWRPLLYVEFADPDLRDRGSSSRELLALFAAEGYRPDADYRDRPLDGVVTDLLLTR
jgi:FkbM family methyltransferase